MKFLEGYKIHIEFEKIDRKMRNNPLNIKYKRASVEMNCTPKVRQKKSNFWGVFIMKLTYEDKVGLTLACLNNKKLVKMNVGKNCYFIQISTIIMTESLLLWSCRRLGLHPLFPKIFGKIHLSLSKT